MSIYVLLITTCIWSFYLLSLLMLFKFTYWFTYLWFCFVFDVFVAFCCFLHVWGFPHTQNPDWKSNVKRPTTTGKILKQLEIKKNLFFAKLLLYDPLTAMPLTRRRSKRFVFRTAAEKNDVKMTTSGQGEVLRPEI